MADANLYAPFFKTDPNAQASAALIQQRQAIAQALLQQGMTPLDPNRMSGGVAYKISPMEGLAKILQSYAGLKGTQEAQQDLAKLAAQQYANQLKLNAPGEGPSFSGEQVKAANALSDGNAEELAKVLVGQTPENRGSVNPRNPANMPAELLTDYTMGMIPKEVFDAQAARYKPTDATMQAVQGGMDPMQANRQAFAKTTTDPKILALRQAGVPESVISSIIYGQQVKEAEQERKPGGAYFNYATGQNGIVPHIPANANITGSLGPNGQVPGVEQIPGAPGVISSTASAEAGGKAPWQVVEAYDPTTNTPTRGYAGNVLPPPAKAPAKSEPSGVDDSYRLQILRQERANPKNTPADNAALDREIARAGGSRGVQAGPALGQADQVKGMQERFTALQTANSQAQGTTSYLQEIKRLSAGAATGRFTDKLQMVNALLSPFNAKATDETTANDLLNKYSNQIVSRLGQNGLGTDAARSILQSAYPNAHMTKEAISEAADNLIAANEMTKAKARLLSPHGNARDAVKYQQTEQAFDQAADPRIWVLKSMTPQAAQKYLSSMQPQDREDLKAKAGVLKQMGAF